MTDALDFIHRMAWSETIEDVWSMLVDRMASEGFERIMYAATRFRNPGSTGDLKDALVLTNYPDGYAEAYLEGGLFRKSPMVRWAMENVGARSWSELAADVAADRLTAEEMEVVAFNAKHGVTAGYLVSFPRSSPREGYGIGVSSTSMDQARIDEVWARRGAEFETILVTAHLTMLSLPYGHLTRTLTDRQREVLELVADGKTIQDAADLIGRNPATVEKHLRLAREALDAETTAQAILKAGVQNQFFRYQA